MLLWGFKKAPKVNVKLAVKGPIGGADLTQFQFIQVRERRRACGALAGRVLGREGGRVAACAGLWCVRARTSKRAAVITRPLAPGRAQGIVAQTIEELLVEPNRGALPLDYDLRVEEVGARSPARF